MFAENLTLEFKRDYTDDIKKTVIAFANSMGGKLYIGLDDDGSAVGVSNVDDTMLRLTNAIRDSIRPDVTLFVECSPRTIDEKPVIILDVQRGTARPYYLVGKGIRPEGVFVRQGASTVPASENAILQMIKETSGDSFEGARSLIQQLTFEKVTEFFNRSNLPLEATHMKTLKLIGEDGTYTNLALLLSEQCMHTIKLAIFQGSTKAVFRDRFELTGSLLHQLEDAYSYIDRYNRTRAEFKGLLRIDNRDYPEDAIRESLLNAIVHREYSYSSSTLISIFDDRIEFVTVGGLVKGISYNDVMLGVSVLRNPNLANIFYRLKLIEAYGTGIMKIINSYPDQADKPQLEVSDNAFKITLPNRNYSGNISLGREETVMKLLEISTSISRSDVQKALGVSQSTAIILLRDMVANGTLKKEGKGNQQKYKLVK